MSKVNELLAVLDMPEDEQLAWIAALYFDNDQFAAGCSLAGLAFQLRDETKSLTNKGGMGLLYKAMVEIHNYLLFKKRGTERGFDAFWFYDVQPIHWIIAALKAKELTKEKK